MKDQLYIRTVRGETMFLPTKQAVEQFLGVEGYRITIEIDGVEFILRRDSDIAPRTNAIEESITSCEVTVRV